MGRVNLAGRIYSLLIALLSAVRASPARSRKNCREAQQGNCAVAEAGAIVLTCPNLKRPALNLRHDHPATPSAFSGYSCHDMLQVKGRTL